MKNKKRNLNLKPVSFVLIIVLTIVLFSGFFFFKEYTGFVSLDTKAGTITELNIYEKTQSYAWQGFYGVTYQIAGYTSLQEQVAQQGGMLEKNLIFACFPSKAGEPIFASKVPGDQIDLLTIRAATRAEVDSYLNYLGFEEDSANKTFIKTISLTIANRTVSNIPATYTYQLDSPGSTSFDLGLLADNNTGELVIFTHSTAFQNGFNGKEYNYQMFVPVKNRTTPTYYFWPNPYADCPQGYGTEVSNATIRGFVKDNETLVPLPYVLVSAGGEATYTDISGFYTFNIPAGAHIIIGQKDGYNIHIDNFTVANGDLLEYNFTMQVSEDTVGTGIGPGIGPGVGTGVGSGTGSGTGTGIGPGEGVGPGVDVGPDFFPQSLIGIGPFVEQPKNIESVDHWISLKEINAKLRIGNFLQDTIYVYRFGNGTANIKIEATDNLKEFVSFDKTELTVEPGKFENFTITIYGNGVPGIHDGAIKFSGSFNDELKTRIQLSPEDKIQVQSLLMDVAPARESEVKGKIMKFRVNLQNLLIEDYYYVFLNYNISNVDGKNSFLLSSDKVKLQTTTSVVKSFKIPIDATNGDYIIRVYATYVGLKSYASAVFEVKESFFMIKILFFRMWHLLTLLGISLFGFGIYKFVKYQIESKKRFHVKVNFKELPRPGPRAGYIGKVAETNIKAYYDLDKLTIHTIVAGSTGGGKSVSAQVLIEEALIKGISVIVFDPTAQWSGMLRKNVNERMIGLYPRFDMKPRDARGFNGNVRAIFNKNEVVDIKKYLKPGEIQIFSLNRIDPADVDIFIANAIKEVFHANFDESQNLRLLLIFDEVHRILPKFGGGGQGFIQIERGCREFRKWGLGIMLISQVLADFVGQIKANINTEVQMRTSDEGDLDRIKTKYGVEFLQYLVKSPVGTGMLVNPAFNKGRPYFIAFRPLLHSIARLPDKELENYNKYNDMIDDFESQLTQLEEEGVDVFDLRLELKLALDKVKTGNFNMVSIYLEGLDPQIKRQWEKIGKKPKKKEVKLADENELKEELEKAEKEREKYEKENAKKQSAQTSPNQTGQTTPPAQTAPAVNNESMQAQAKKPMQAQKIQQAQQQNAKKPPTIQASTGVSTANISNQISNQSTPNINVQANPINKSANPNPINSSIPSINTNTIASNVVSQQIQQPTQTVVQPAQPITNQVQKTLQQNTQNVKEIITNTQQEINKG